MLAVLLLAGCGGSGAASSSGQQGSPKRGGTLDFARSQEPQSLDPVAVADNGSLYTRLQIYDTLVRANPAKTGPPVLPDLAESWKSSPNGLSWTFHLRRANFSDGSPVTAADVQFSLGRFANPKINTGLSSLAYGIDKIEAPDANTVVVTLKHPVGALLENLSVAVASIVPKKLVEAQGANFWNKPVGSGPFMVSQWVRGSYMVLKRNPYYWAKGLPYLNEVRFDFIPDNNARILKIEGGGADVAEDVPYTQIATLRATSGIDVRVDAIPLWDAIFLNQRVKPMNDLRVREALNYAVDKSAMNQAVYGGVATPANDMMPQVRFTAPPSVVPPYAFDLAKAKQLMAASSAPHGFSATLLYPAGATVQGDLATILQADWAKIGVKLNLQEVGAAALTSRYFAGRWQMAIPTPSFTSDVPVPDEVALLFYEPPPANPIGGFATGWKMPPRLWQLTQAFVNTANDTQRASLWPQIQKLAMSQAPWVTLFFVPAVTAVRNDVHGFSELPVGGWDLSHVWLSK
jgi:peptide/nickel transport system substrate-binding protein